MAAGDSRSKALEWQPGVLLSKKLRLGKESPGTPPETAI
jgi:hypothetical protein